MSIHNDVDEAVKERNAKYGLKYLVAAMILGIIVLVSIFAGSSSNKLTEAEKQAITQMEEKLQRSYINDILEFHDGKFAIVTNKNDHGLTTKYAFGGSGLQSYEKLSKNVVAIYTTEDPEYCSALKKFIASF